MALAALYWIAAVAGARTESPTFDEPIHLTGGYSYWAFGDFRVNPDNGLLPQRWATLPLLFDDVAFPSRDGPAWWHAQRWALADAFLYEVGNDPESLLGRARAWAALLGCGLGLLIYGWSRHLFGRGGGILSAALFATSPTLLAHGRLVTSDLAAALFFLAATAALWALLARVTLPRLLCAGGAVGGLLLAKMSGLLVVLIAPLLVLVRAARREPLPVHLGWLGWQRPLRGAGEHALALVASGLAVAGIALALVWAAYGFRYEALASGEPGRDRLEVSWVELAAQGAVGPDVAIARAWQVLPEAYLYGLTSVRAAARGEPAFLDGRTGHRGWPSFFARAFLYKTPLSTLALLALAAAAGAAAWRRATPEARGRRLVDLAPLAVLLLVYGAVAADLRLNIGHRHILPLYPPLFVLAGGAARWIARGPRALAIAVPALVALGAVQSAAVWPHPLAFFNPLAGGPAGGWRHLVDSSLDWGQDLPALARWLDEHGDADRPVYLAYFGSARPAAHGVRARRLPGQLYRGPERIPPAPLEPGTYCISATLLQSVFPPAAGAWRAAYEAEYQRLARELPRLTDPEELRHASERFEKLRLARLCAVLRRREPDARAGWSILVYEVGPEELERAVSGPPPVEGAGDPPGGPAARNGPPDRAPAWPPHRA